MKKMLSVLTISLLIIGGMPLIGIESANTNTATNLQKADDIPYHLGLIFEEPKKDKVVNHIAPANGAPDVRASKSSENNSASSIDNS